MKIKINILIKDIRLILGLFKRKTKYFKVPFIQSIKMKLWGFKPEHYHMYNLKNNNKKEYITEIERWKTRRINKHYNIVLDDKLIFYEMFRKYINIPKIHGWTSNNLMFDLNGNLIDYQKFLTILEKEKKIIVKPNYGAGGRGVYLITYVDSINSDVNGKLMNNYDIYTKLLKKSDYLINSYVKQHSYACNLYKYSTNTIRIVTIINENGRAEIPIAIHRIGTKDTIPVDNAAKGGLFSKIDLETGELSGAKSYRIINELDRHPDTGSQIKGIIVPNWANIKQQIINVAEKFPYIPFMAWDVVVTEAGISIIEINASSGLDFFQMFEPQRYTILGDFYRRHGVIK